MSSKIVTVSNLYVVSNWAAPVSNWARSNQVPPSNWYTVSNWAVHLIQYFDYSKSRSVIGTLSIIGPFILCNALIILTRNPRQVSPFDFLPSYICLSTQKTKRHVFFLIRPNRVFRGENRPRKFRY